jgi:hypothetical protein
LSTLLVWRTVVAKFGYKLFSGLDERPIRIEALAHTLLRNLTLPGF